MPLIPARRATNDAPTSILAPQLPRAVPHAAAQQLHAVRLPDCRGDLHMSPFLVADYHLPNFAADALMRLVDFLIRPHAMQVPLILAHFRRPCYRPAALHGNSRCQAWRYSPFGRLHAWIAIRC